MSFYDILFWLIVVLALIYYYVNQRYSYWKRWNIPYIQPNFPFGNLKLLRSKIHISQLLVEYYHELKGSAPFGGLYFFTTPSILATNLDFIKSVLIKDFNHFVSRAGVFSNEKDDPLSGHLIAVDGDKWKRLRTKLTPFFTSGKMKSMQPLILHTADELIATMTSLINGTNADIEMKDILGRFTTDVIGTCAFGIDCNSLRNEDAEFRKYGRAVFEKPRDSFLKLLFLNNFKELARKLKIKHISDDVSKFFLGCVRDTIRFREENNVQRQDFLNMMIQLQKHGKLDGDETAKDSVRDRLTFNEIAAQCFVFFIAGFETSASTLTFCLFELSLNLDIQMKARQEVMDIMKKYDGKLTYEAVLEMHFIDRIIQETLRKYPVVSNLLRECTKDYPVPNTDYCIRKRTTVTIPVYAIHHDPQIYHDPSIFNPDRFLPEEIQKRHPLSYLPWGEGPRNCLGIRFGQMQTRVGLASILKNFEFSPCSKSINPIILASKTVLLAPEGGVWLNVKRIVE